MKASVKTFIELYENPVVILGNMGELGENEQTYHKEVGKYLADINKNLKTELFNIKPVQYITVGNLAGEIGNELIANGFDVEKFKTNQEAADYILKNLNNKHNIFLKASRAMKFEEILEEIKRGTDKL